MAPPTTRLAKDIAAWLAELDYDDLMELARVGRHHEMPIRNWRVRDWWIQFTFMPKSARGTSPTIGFYPAEDVADPRAEILPTLRKKASHYGELDRPEHEVHLRVILPVAFGATEVRPRR